MVACEGELMRIMPLIAGVPSSKIPASCVAVISIFCPFREERLMVPVRLSPVLCSAVTVTVCVLRPSPTPSAGSNESQLSGDETLHAP